MRITVYFSNGAIKEYSDVKDTRKVWRNVSKLCKAYGKFRSHFINICGTEWKVRVTKVVKED